MAKKSYVSFENQLRKVISDVQLVDQYNCIITLTNISQF